MPNHLPVPDFSFMHISNGSFEGLFWLTGVSRELMHGLSATRSSSNQKIANDLWGAIRKLAHICKWYAMICTGKVTRSLAFSMRASSDMSTSHWWCNRVHFYANKQRCIGVHAIYNDLYLEILRLRLNSIACIPNHLLSHFIVCKT